MMGNTIELVGEISTGSINGVIDNAGTGYISGTDDYDTLNNKPSINDVILMGNKSFEDLGINEVTDSELDIVFDDLNIPGDPSIPENPSGTNMNAITNDELDEIFKDL